MMNEDNLSYQKLYENGINLTQLDKMCSKNKHKVEYSNIASFS